MSLHDRAQELQEQVNSSSLTYRIKEVLDTLLPLVLAVLMVSLYYEFFTALNPVQHQIVIFTQRIILLYFLLELTVDLSLYQDNTAFLKDRWLDILLIVPFFTAIRSYGAAMKGFKGAKSVKSLKTAATLEGLTPAKLAKGSKTAKHSTKAVKKLRDLVGGE